MPIDMWSFGCILAELYTGYPLFPGKDFIYSVKRHGKVVRENVLNLFYPDTKNKQLSKNVQLEITKIQIEIPKNSPDIRFWPQKPKSLGSGVLDTIRCMTGNHNVFG